MRRSQYDEYRAIISRLLLNRFDNTYGDMLRGERLQMANKARMFIVKAIAKLLIEY